MAQESLILCKAWSQLSDAAKNSILAQLYREDLLGHKPHELRAEAERQAWGYDLEKAKWVPFIPVTRKIEDGPPTELAEQRAPDIKMVPGEDKVIPNTPGLQVPDGYVIRSMPSPTEVRIVPAEAKQPDIVLPTLVMLSKRAMDMLRETMQKNGLENLNQTIEFMYNATGVIGTAENIVRNAEYAHRKIADIIRSVLPLFQQDVSDWTPLPDLEGVVSQLDNTVAGLKARIEKLEAGARHDEAWMKVAVESNKAIHEYLRTIKPDLPKKYGMPADGVRIVVESLRATIAEKSAKVEGVHKAAETLAGQANKLQKFKTYVHERLDKMGIPTFHPGENTDPQQDCRIGRRLDYVASHLVRAIDYEVGENPHLPRDYADEQLTEACRRAKQIPGGPTEAPSHMVETGNVQFYRLWDDLSGEQKREIEKQFGTADKWYTERNVALRKKDDGQWVWIDASVVDKKHMPDKDGQLKALRDRIRSLLAQAGVVRQHCGAKGSGLQTAQNAVNSLIDELTRLGQFIEANFPDFAAEVEQARDEIEAMFGEVRKRDFIETATIELAAAQLVSPHFSPNERPMVPRLAVATAERLWDEVSKFKLTKA